MAWYKGTGGKAKITWHQCPEAVRDYLTAVTYDPSDYTTSEIANYAPAVAVDSNYRPIGKNVGGETHYNEVPGIETPFAAGSIAGTLKPLDFLRYIKTGTWNVRDLGGWPCDGGTVKYGLLFRGGEPTTGDYNVLVKQLGIKYDLNLRGAIEATWTKSPLGDDVYFVKADDYNWYSLTNKEAWRINLRCVFDAVSHGEPVYFHCAAGADRTGTLACILEGLLGMSQSDIDKDYELTTFYSGSGTDANARRRNEADWTGLIGQIQAKNGNTFRDKCITFVAELGFTAAEINAYRKAMINGTPETVTVNVNSYSVTNTLTNVTSDNAATAATQYQPYEAGISTPKGYVIEDVKVTMGGVDITASVFSGAKTVLKRKVTSTATNCTVDGKKAVIDGQDFVATVTAHTGYTISEVTITMGGTDVSSYYENGKISIPNVTGDIVITAKAIQNAVSYKDQIAISTDTDGSVYNSKGYKENQRLNSSGAVVANEAGLGIGPIVTGFIPVSPGDVIRFKNAYILKYNNGSYNTWEYDASHNKLSTNPITPYALLNNTLPANISAVTESVDANHEGIVKMTLPLGLTAKYIRFTLDRVNSEEPIITINEEID